MQQHERTVLGLDLGTASVGWALFELDAEYQPSRLIDLGVRHFQEVIEPKSKELKNVQRRRARQLRKNLRRRRQRRDNLLSALQDSGMAPHGIDPFAESESEPNKPYEIRARAAREAVPLEELGRALFHLAKRRGFKSNRGAKMASLAGDPEVQGLLAGEASTEEGTEEGLILESIAHLRQEIGSRTLGQYLWDEIQAGKKVRGRYTDRLMYEDEFEQIWSMQAGCHHSVLTDELKTRLAYAIFHQRPLKIQKCLKGKCLFEPKKVCAERAQLIAQRFRYWQDLATTKLTDLRSGEVRSLTPIEKNLLAQRLEGQPILTWAAIRKELKIAKTVEINLERSKRAGLQGNATVAKIVGKAPLYWAELAEEGQERLVETLLTIPDRGLLFRTLRTKLGLSPREAYELAIVDLEGGTASLSSKAMRRMLPLMMSGSDRIEAQAGAGYAPWIGGIEPLARLPGLPKRAELPNPKVRKALGQVRKVVNAIIATYGPPEIVRIEMARDLSLSKSEKLGLQRANQALEKENAEADNWFQATGVENPNRTDRIWYRLAKQCGWVCPYTGETISQDRANASRFTIEHIVPYSRCLDDSFNNLTLCDPETKARKGSCTPFEAFGADLELWARMRLRCQGWEGCGCGHKRKLFLLETQFDEDEMKSRQLSQTRYICRLAALYLRPICKDVQFTKGQAISRVRSQWGLSETLGECGQISRDDLRRHAVDAVAVAFTSLSLFGKVPEIRQRLTIEPLSDQTVPPQPPWLQQQVSGRLRTVVISHEPTRGIREAFHKETAMGRRAEGLYQFRKPLVFMKEGEIREIVDSRVRELALEAFLASSQDAKKAFAQGLRVGDTTAHRARIVRRLPHSPMLGVPQQAPTKFFELGNNHHVEIFETEDGKRKARFVTTLEAAQRARPPQGQSPLPIVDTTPPAPGWRFVMSLAPNDMIRIHGDDREFFKLESIWSTTNQLALRQHLAATQDDKRQRLLKSISVFDAIKIEVDPIGRVREIREGIRISPRGHRASLR